MANFQLSMASRANHDYAEARQRAIVANEAYDQAVRADPSNSSINGFRTWARHEFARLLFQDGKIDEGIKILRTQLVEGEQSRKLSFASDLAGWEEARGNRAAAEAARVERDRLRAATRQNTASGPGNGFTQREAARLHWYRGEYGKCVEEAKQAVSLAEARLATPDLTRQQRNGPQVTLLEASYDRGRGNIFLGNWTEAEAQLRRALELKFSNPSSTPRAFQAAIQAAAPSWLAIALARQGRLAEAADVIAGSRMKNLQAFYAKGDNTLDVRWDLARSHYASALTQPDDGAGREKRTAALRQAKALLDESTEEAKQLTEERELRRLIDEELALLGRK